MGVTAAIVSAGLAIGASAYSANQQRKAQKEAEAKAREAEKRNVTVQSRAATTETSAAEQEPQSELARQNAAKRRRGINRTILNNNQLTSSLLGNSTKLGGV